MKTSDRQTEKKSFPFVSCLMALFALSVHLIPSLPDFMDLKPECQGMGLIVRLFTCHFTHWSWDQLFWDLAVFVTLCMEVEKSSVQGALVCILVSAFSISLMLIVMMPEALPYRGLSGVDSALLGWGLCERFKTTLHGNCRIAYGLIAVLFIGKIFYEMEFNQCLFVRSLDGVVPLPETHLMGFVVGVILAVLSMRPIGLLKRLEPGKNPNKLVYSKLLKKYAFSNLKEVRHDHNLQS